jgi:predicted HTH transcriptional regulator
MHNLNLASNGLPNLTGWLLFGKLPQSRKPAFLVKAVAFPGTVIHDSSYLDSEDLEGSLQELYQRGMAFIKRNLRHVQGEKSFNSPGSLEVPEDVFEELLVNALVHRDYFIIAPIRLLIFSDRIEIISPGHLPNHLDTEQIRYGLSNLRNPALASHAFHLLPYRGLGSGIPRATEAWPDIDLINDPRGNQFKAIVMRPAIKDKAIKAESQAESQAESLNERIVAALHSGPLSKSEIAAALGMRGVTGHLNLGIRKLLAEGSISLTRPESPNSRLQKYRL